MTKTIVLPVSENDTWYEMCVFLIQKGYSKSYSDDRKNLSSVRWWNHSVITIDNIMQREIYFHDDFPDNLIAEIILRFG